MRVKKYLMLTLLKSLIKGVLYILLIVINIMAKDRLKQELGLTSTAQAVDTSQNPIEYYEEREIQQQGRINQLTKDNQRLKSQLRASQRSRDSATKKLELCQKKQQRQKKYLSVMEKLKSLKDSDESKGAYEKKLKEAQKEMQKSFDQIITSKNNEINELREKLSSQQASHISQYGSYQIVISGADAIKSANQSVEKQKMNSPRAKDKGPDVKDILQQELNNLKSQIHQMERDSKTKGELQSEQLHNTLTERDRLARQLQQIKKQLGKKEEKRQLIEADRQSWENRYQSEKKKADQLNSKLNCKSSEQSQEKRRFEKQLIEERGRLTKLRVQHKSELTQFLKQDRELLQSKKEFMEINSIQLKNMQGKGKHLGHSASKSYEEILIELKACQQDKRALIDQTCLIINQLRQINQHQENEASKTMKLKEQTSEQLDKLKGEIHNVKALNFQVDQELKSTKSEVKKMATQLSKSKDELVRVQASAKTLEKEYSELKISTNAQISSLNSQITSLKDQIISKDSEIQKYNKTINQLQNELRMMKQQLENEKKSKQQNSEEYSRRINQSRVVLNDKEKYINELEGKNNCLNRNVQDYKAKLSDAKDRRDSLREENEQFSMRLFDLNKELISPLTMTLLNKTTELKMRDPDYQEQCVNLLEEMRQGIDRIRFFHDSVVLSSVHVSFVVQAIKNLTGGRPSRIVSLYRYDTKNPTSFHQYIDYKDNILCLIKIKTGAIIGGFSSHQLNEHKVVKPGEGIIFNVNKEKVFFQKKENKYTVLPYDRYYFMMGNSEIRLKVGEAKVFSNFSITASVFDAAGFPRTSFLGTTEHNHNELEIETYEFYEVQME